MKRAAAMILALVLTLTLLPAPARAASSPAFGSEIWLRDTILQNGVTYSENIFWSGSYDKPRHEYYFTYTPGIGGNLPSAWADEPAGDPNTSPFGLPSWMSPNQEPSDSGSASDWPDDFAPWTSGSLEAGVRPVASYGSSVCSRSTVSEAAKKYEALGYRVVGAINGDFYDMSTGYPLGILISDGEILSGSSEYFAVGFRADGSVVMGQPQLSIVATSSSGSLKLASLNKPRVDEAGVTMLTSDYRDDHTTGSSVASDGVNVLATVIDGRAALGGTLTVRVDEVVEDDQVRTLADDQILLTGSVNGYDAGLGFLRALTPGETVAISFTANSPKWDGVTEAIGAYHMLVENGVAHDEFEVSAAPRTAAGLKANGDLILYTLDGRQDSVSMGSSLGVLAQRMVELGCVTAVCLDGGGSTTAVAAMPDSSTSKLLNSPSDKSQRSVTNHILLLAPGGATGVPGGVTLSAGAPAVLAGHTVDLSANVTDTHYYPMDLPVTFFATAGEVQDNTFTAPASGGTVTVTAVYDLWSAQKDILVVDAPSSMEISYAGGSSATVIAGNTARMDLKAYYNRRVIEISNEDVVWSVDPSLGTIDASGVFTASLQSGSGVITATRGNTQATIPVVVEMNHPFEDLAGHWAEPYMGLLYQQKVLNGELAEDGLLYARPERGLTRAEFSVLLARYLKLDTAEYAAAAAPFTDLDSVESWAGNAIRAMYSLGIVSGIDDTHFNPQGSLERAQAAAMLGRAFNLTETPEMPEDPSDEPALEEPVGEAPPDPSVLPSWWEDSDGDEDEPPPPVLPDEVLSLSQLLSLSDYPDADQIPGYAEIYFRILESKGALGGRDGMILPRSPITRAEICKALVVMENNQA